jgi:hypothetical protein
MFVGKNLIGNFWSVKNFVGKKKHTRWFYKWTMHAKKNYQLEYTKKIILSVIGSCIWSNFIQSRKIPIE